MRRIRLLKWFAITAIIVFTVCTLFNFQYGTEIQQLPNSAQTSSSRTNLISILSSPEKSGLEDHDQFLAPIHTNYGSFENAVAEKANGKGEIILISTDMGYASMSLNFYVTSLAKFNITNYLFVGSDAQVCGFLHKHGVACFAHFDNKIGDKASSWGTSEFRRKTHLKTKIILDSLLLNYTVLISDVDIVFFKNPWEHFHCQQCDIQIQNDGKNLNSGFYLSRPSKPNIKLHQMAWNRSLQSNSLTNQRVINSIMGEMMNTSEIKVKILSSLKFPNGDEYFAKGKRMFLGDSPCKDCVMVHNNFIVSGDAKEFRFKEHGLWGVDIDGYYGNPDTRYIMYSNRRGDQKENTLKRELNALKNALALGFLLNRTVIMPSFTCFNCKSPACKAAHGRCSFHTHFRVTTFNEHFQGKYREHVFLQHPRVPQAVKKSISPIFTIESRYVNASATLSPEPHSAVLFTPHNVTKGASVSEIMTWFGRSLFSVLQFSSLEGIFSGFPSSANQFDDINQKLRNALVSATYIQKK